MTWDYFDDTILRFCNLLSCFLHCLIIVARELCELWLVHLASPIDFKRPVLGNDHRAPAQYAARNAQSIALGARAGLIHGRILLRYKREVRLKGAGFAAFVADPA